MHIQYSAALTALLAVTSVTASYQAPAPATGTDAAKDTQPAPAPVPAVADTPASTTGGGYPSVGNPAPAPVAPVPAAPTPAAAADASSGSNNYVPPPPAPVSPPPPPPAAPTPAATGADASAGNTNYVPQSSPAPAPEPAPVPAPVPSPPAPAPSADTSAADSATDPSTLYNDQCTIFYITKPYAKTVYTAGQTCGVTWKKRSSYPSDAVTVDLLKIDGNPKNATLIGEIGHGSASFGKCPITIPQDVAPADDYMVRVCAMKDGQNHCDYSHSFTILAADTNSTSVDRSYDPSAYTQSASAGESIAASLLLVAGTAMGAFFALI